MTNPLADDPRLAKIYEADAALTAPGMPFEIVEDDVLGERMPVFRNRHANLREQLLAGAARYGDGDLFVWSDGRRQTFSGLVPEVAEVAAGLRDRYGIAQGDRVAICSANNPEWILTFWACASLDAVLVAMNGWWTGAEMRNALELTEPSVLIMDEKRAARLDGELSVPTIVIERDWKDVPVAGVTELPDVDLAEDDAMELIFTSGTTGRPKAAVLSHRSIIAYVQLQTYGMARSMGMAGVSRRTAAPRPPVRLAVYPLFHVSGLSTIGRRRHDRARRACGRSAASTPAAVIELTKREGINMWGGGTTHVVRLLEHPDVDDRRPHADQERRRGRLGHAARRSSTGSRRRFPHLTGTTSSGLRLHRDRAHQPLAPNWMLRGAPDCVGPLSRRSRSASPTTSASRSPTARPGTSRCAAR